MTINPQDLRAAVQRGVITEAQAATLTGMAEARRSARASTTPAEEPFVLFKGFNEIFIVIGLSILFAGWVALTAVFSFDLKGERPFDTILVALVTLAGLAVVSRYFTLKRRMIAPSIALVVMAAIAAGTLGWALALAFGLTDMGRSAFGWAVVTGVMVLHYRIFRVPFAAAVIACAAFSTIWSLLAAAEVVPGTGAALVSFAAEGPASVLSILFGLAAFALAMRFDMSDPHRVSTRSATGFWLHVVAAPLIVNPVAIRFLGVEGAGSQMLLLIFLLALAVVAIVIDRRSFLVSGAAYAVVLTFTLFDGSALVIVFLGLGLVLLGANWERLRTALMRALPAFPGKDRLPPYASVT